MVYGSVRNLPVSWRRKKASLKYKYSSRALGQHELGTCNPERALHLNVQSINKKECKSLYFASVLFSTAQKTTQEDKCISLHWYLVTWYPLRLCFCVLNSVFVNYYLQLVNKLVAKAWYRIQSSHNLQWKAASLLLHTLLKDQSSHL